MIVKAVNEKGFDADKWFPTALNINPNGTVGVTYGLFHSREEWEKGTINNIAEQGLEVQVPTKVFTDLLIATEQATVAVPGGFFEGCPIEP